MAFTKKQLTELKRKGVPHKMNLKKQVWKRDEWTCVYCGLKMKESYEAWQAQIKKGRVKGEKKIKRSKHVPITVDHIVPLSKGGEWSLENLATACKPCNLKKGNKYEPTVPIPPKRKALIYRLLEMLAVWL